MKTYHVKSGIRCIGFDLTDGPKRVNIYSAKFTEPSNFTESELLDSPVRRKIGTSTDIEDDRFSIVNEFSKYGYYTFQRWRDNNSSDPDNRVVIAVHQEDIGINGT